MKMDSRLIMLTGKVNLHSIYLYSQISIFIHENRTREGRFLINGNRAVCFKLSAHLRPPV